MNEIDRYRGQKCSYRHHMRQRTFPSGPCSKILQQKSKFRLGSSFVDIYVELVRARTFSLVSFSTCTTFVSKCKRGHCSHKDTRTCIPRKIASVRTRLRSNYPKSQIIITTLGGQISRIPSHRLTFLEALERHDLAQRYLRNQHQSCGVFVLFSLKISVCSGRLQNAACSFLATTSALVLFVSELAPVAELPSNQLQ